MSALSLLSETKQLLRKYGLHARKKLGQHFLINGQVLKLITSAAELTFEDTVVEVGPGLGTLTEALAKHAGRVVAVELDNRLADIATERLASYHNVTIINDDVLNIDTTTLPTGYKVVADIPYYITSPILRHFLSAHCKPERVIIMVQKEVAQAIVAGAGGRGVLSVIVQFYGKPSIVSYIPSRYFYPPPEVDSAILRIDVFSEPEVKVSDERAFFDMVQAGFSARRKQIGNSLAQGLRISKTEVLPFLEQSGISPQRRAETLSIEEWVNLWQAVSQGKTGE